MVLTGEYIQLSSDQENLFDLKLQKCEPNPRKIWLTMKEGAYMGG